MARPCLIVEFTVESLRYRLVRLAKEDGGRPLYQIERAELDRLDCVRWVDMYSAFSTTPHSREGILVDLVEQLVLRDPDVAAAHKLGGWEAVHEVLRARGAES